jgi:tetratricopeptide (TPR) repeat protein
VKDFLAAFLLLLACGSVSPARAVHVKDFFAEVHELYFSDKVAEAVRKVRQVLDQRTDKEFDEVRRALEGIPPQPVDWAKVPEEKRNRWIKALLDGLFMQDARSPDVDLSDPEPKPSAKEGSFERHYQDGMVQYRKGRWNEALIEFQAAANWDTHFFWGHATNSNHNWKALQMLGQTYQRIGNIDQALRVYESCLDVYPDNFEVVRQVHRLKGLPAPTPLPTPAPDPRWGVPVKQESEEVHQVPASLLDPAPAR